MSFTTTLVTSAAGGAVAASPYMSYKQGKEQVQAQKDANAISQRNADRLQKESEIAFNKLNRRKASPMQTLLNAQKTVASTERTGPQGVDPSTLTLGRNTLLGA